jgi:hypothetical protein
MKKLMVVALAVCLVVMFAGSIWAADIPGQKLTQDEMASVTGKFSPVAIPAGFFDSLSNTGTTVFINGQQVPAVYKTETIDVKAFFTLIK